MENYLTEEELAEKLRVSRVFLYELRKQGLPFRRIHRTIRYLPEEVETWLVQHGQGSADAASHKMTGEI